MKVKRAILISAKDGISIMQVNTTYRKRMGADLLQGYSELVGSDTFGKYFQRASEDNGKTWSKPSLIFEPEETEEGVLRWGENVLFLDEEKDAILHFYNYHLYPGNHYTGDVGKFTRIFLRISSNGGESFSKPEQIIQKGFDKKNWAKDVVYGRNSMGISFCAPVKTSKGEILLPVQRVPLGSDFSHPFLIKEEAGCFIGEWKGEKIEWDLGKMVKINPDGNRPRYPLQIAEVDEDKKAIIRETVNIIEDKQKRDSPFVQFSNFKVYENRETNEFVLTMARIQERNEKDLTSPAYQYRIKI